MTQTERRIYWIKKLLAEHPRYRSTPVPGNILEVQNEYLREELIR